MSLDESLEKVLARHRELGEMLLAEGVADDPAVSLACPRNMPI